MKVEISQETRDELKVVIESMADSLDITKTQYDNLERSCNAVGDFLCNTEEFEAYHPKATKQGSFNLGTIIQPINEEDDLDVDLVLRIDGKHPAWTQKDIKTIVGNRIKSSDRYGDMLDKEEGRRCWTLLYRGESEKLKERYHLDILPSVSAKEHDNILFEMRRSSADNVDYQRSALRITDKKRRDYETSHQIEEWNHSNPDGYALWFFNQCRRCSGLQNLILESAVPSIVTPSAKKTPLQRVVQILKRHRDVMFAEDVEDKPVSIIITTLAAKAYGGESDILDALFSVVKGMRKHLIPDGKGGYIVSNPVDSKENFADKWKENRRKQDNFLKWLTAIENDISAIYSSVTKDERYIKMSRSFGNTIAKQAFISLGESKRSNMAMKAVSATGALAAVGRKLNASNTFYGTES